MRHTALVRGLGDVGSAVAHRLFTAGYGVAIQDDPQPTTTRRKMAFADAAFDGMATLEGVVARCSPETDTIPHSMRAGVIAVWLGPLLPLLNAIEPHVLVDARMRKRAVPETQRGLAPLVIGLGPNFRVGDTCDVAVETSWDALGAVIRGGMPLAFAGEPRLIAGHARDRYVYAPCGGVFRTALKIGDPVATGQPVATIDRTVLSAPLPGVLRGLTHDEVPVRARTKVIEVDPRFDADVTGIGDRPRQIAEGVLRAISESAAGWRTAKRPD